jgi:signal transduction histidine kinase
LLQQGADNFSGLISVLQTRRRKNWEKQQHVRRQEIYDATLPTHEEAFEWRVCSQALKSYQASEARFYKVEFVEDTPQIALQMSLRYDQKTERAEASVVAPDEEKLVRMAAQANRDNEKVFLTERLQLGGKEWEGAEWSDPGRVAVSGLVRRACVPLFSQKQIVGLLDLHWSGNYPQADATASKPVESLFRVVGEIIGSAYRNTQTTTQAETLRQEAETKLQEGEDRLQQSKNQTRDVVETTSVYVLKHHHELRRIIQQMSSLIGSLRALPGEVDEKEKELTDQLYDKIVESKATLRKMIGIGRKMALPRYKRQTLRGIILSALQKARLNYPYDIQVNQQDLPEEYSVLVDAQLIEIAFSYLLDNSIKAMRSKDRRILEVRMESVANNGDVRITIEDTGIGMTREEIQQILREFFSRRGRISVGVTIARMILGLHAGRLAYESDKGEWTKTLITLPLNYYLEEEEEAYD